MEASKTTIRPAILWVVLALVYAIGLSFYKQTLLQDFAQSSTRALKARHAGVMNLFQASFYFFYEDQFVPGVQQAVQATQGLERVQVLSAVGQILYDSKESSPKNPPAQDQAKVHPNREIVARLATSASNGVDSEASPVVLISGFNVQILMTAGQAGQYGVLYTFEAAAVRTRILVALAVGLVLGSGLFWLTLRFRRPRNAAWRHAWQMRWRRIWGLRTKFMMTIVVINLVTGGIVFWSLSTLQTREQTQRIEKEAVLFSQFSTGKVISDFSNFFYFYYPDKFVPGIKTIISANENLLGIRIISRRTGSVLFDSESATGGPVPAVASSGDAAKAQFPADIESELKAHDVAVRRITRDGDRLLSIVNTYKNENQEALFLVEYVFSFHSLVRSVATMREQILIDLVPSMAFGLLIALIFSQLLISPIRRLVAALQRVSAGDYDVSVELKKSDEIGELVSAFNAMTGELKKKKELRKYLSDSTYRQIMEAPDTPGGAPIGGARVSATVIFTDIRDFVSHCESLEAEEVTAMLNEYFTEMVEVVYKYGGEVDKFIGDALLAVFYSPDGGRRSSGQELGLDGTPVSTALHAVYCALEMRERLNDFNERRRGLNKNMIDIGVGITHGEIISGPIGSKDRMDFTVIGDVVNLANRIEKLSKQGNHTKIVFSHHVEELVRGLLEYEEMQSAQIRGKEEEVRVYELVRVRDLQTLVQNLESADVTLRRRSIELLGQSRNLAALPDIIRVLDDGDEGVRIQAVGALTKLAPWDHPETLDRLFGRLSIEKSSKVVSAVIAALGRICTTPRILDLEPFLSSPEERVVANAVEAIGQVSDPRCTDILLPKISSRNNRVKANAAMALFAAGHFEVIDILKPMLMHSDPLMRSSAAFAIGELTLLAEKDRLIREWKEKGQVVKTFLGELQECVPMLVGLLKDPDLMVKRQAVVALGKIKDRSSVLALIDNVNLESDSKELIRDISEALRAIGSHKLVREVISRLH